MKRGAAIGLVLTILLLAPWKPAHAGTSQPSPTSTSDASPLAVEGHHVDVGGYRLYLQCVGRGSPTVVLDGDGFVEDWLKVQSTVGSFTRTCAYDRAGLGMSDRGPMPTSTGLLARQLHTLLVRAHLPGPYILGGYAFGGSTLRLFARRYRSEVEGLVLIDALHEDLLRPALVPNSGDIDLAASWKQLYAVRSLGALPLMVLTHGVYLSYPEEVERAWLRSQRELARLSSNSTLVIARHSAHPIVDDQPLLVDEAIFQVWLAERGRPRGLLTCGFWLQMRGGTCANQ